jgi:parallel beta-helix repeat protein
MPLIRIAPGIYRENLLILKSVFLKGIDPNTTIIQGQLDETSAIPFAVFIAGSLGVAVGITGVTVEGGVQIIGVVGGLIYNNHFLPDPELGLSGMFVSGLLNLWVLQNRFVGGNLSNQGLLAVDLSFGVFSEGILDSGQDSLILQENTFTGVSSRPRNSAGPAVAITHAEFVRIEGNHIFANEDLGLELRDVKLTKILDNRIEGNRAGIDTSDSSLLIIGNEVNRNREYGVALRDGSYSFEENTVSENGDEGLVLFGLLSQADKIDWSVKGNEITQNRIGLSMNDLMFLPRLKCVGNRIRENVFADYVVGESQPSEALQNHCEEPQ